MTGLWDAIIKQGNARSGEAFEWYARVRIRGAILDELRTQDWLPRRARAAAARAAKDTEGAAASAPVVLRLDDVSESEQARHLVSAIPRTDELIEKHDVSRTLARAVDKLPERERHIVSKHYFEGMKFKDLGRMLGVSEPRVSQLHSRAMGRLKGLLEVAA
jgi:RNA polymerase sigma factor for flagellar operon FliA